MYSLKNKIVFVTGASSGIGMACVEQFASLGASVIMVARRLEKMEALGAQLKQKYDTSYLAIALDVTDKNQVQKIIDNLPVTWKNIDILINNAGLALGLDLFQEGNLEHWDKMIDTNIKGLLYVTHAILPTMILRNSGHIINIGSIAGRETYLKGNIYSATKHAVRAISQSLRIDLLGKSIRLTEIAPGAVETEFSEVRFNSKELAKAVYADFEPLVADDIADAVIYCATRKPSVNIAELLITPVVQASVNHLYRGEQK